MPIRVAGGLPCAIAHTEGFVQYIISSRGRPIGTSDLDFLRIDGSSRSGWFHPNAFGESLMPTAALTYPAVRAFICQDVRDDDGQSILQPSFRSSTLFADLADAYHRVAALELTLHRPDGTLIPTSMLGIQDTEALRKFAEWRRTYPLGEVLIEAEPWYEEFASEVEESPSDWAESDEGVGDIDIESSWSPDEDATELPRYQVHLVLVR
jgi:hypothetical protein